MSTTKSFPADKVIGDVRGLSFDAMLDLIFAVIRVGNTEELLAIKEQREDCSQWIDSIFLVLDVCGPQYFTNALTVEQDLLPFLLDKVNDTVSCKYAQYLLAKLTENGMGVEKNAKKAIKYLEESAALNCADSLFALALRYQPVSSSSSSPTDASRSSTDSSVEKDFNKYLDLLRRAAELEHAEAAYRLGLIYEGVSEIASTASTPTEHTGKTAANVSPQDISTAITKDLTLALQYFKQASKLGYVDAMFKLANCYFYGSLVDKNFDEAFPLFFKCAQRGVLQAQYLVGVCFEKGLGTEIDVKTAFVFYTLAAGDPNDNFQGGNTLAQHALAICLEQGLGTEVNKPLALKLLKIAADKGVTQAQVSIAQKYHYGVDVNKSILVAMKYYGMAAEHGQDATAWFNLGLVHFLGENTTNANAHKLATSPSQVTPADKQRNLDQALLCFQNAAARGSSAALYHLGVMHEHGLNVEQDLEKAIQFYSQAADKHDPHALLRMGLFHMEGNAFIKKDASQAVRCFEQSAALGDPIAQFNLGLAHLNGDGCTQSVSTAEENLRKSATTGYLVAQHRLGVAYEHGEFGEQDLVQAKHFYSSSAQQGYLLSKEALDRIQ